MPSQENAAQQAADLIREGYPLETAIAFYAGLGYPPFPPEVQAGFVEAVKACAAGNGNAETSLPTGRPANVPGLPAYQVVFRAQLQPIVAAVRGDEEDPDY